MSEKHLLKFQTEADYRTAKKNHLLLPNVSSVVETGEVHINPKFVSKQNAEAGDIIVYHTHSNGEKEIAYMKPEAYDAATETYWEPDAIVVVPYSHTNDGTVRAISLKYADLASPSTGGLGKSIIWGWDASFATNKVEGLTDYTGALKFSNYNNQVYSTHGIASEVYLPSDNFTGSKKNPYDDYTVYNASTNYAPSPYTNDGGKNDAYFSTGDFVSETNNSLKDMDGKANTLKILQSLDPNYLDYSLLATPLTDEGKVVVGQNNVKLYPAACACARYSSALKPYAYNANKTIEENVVEGLMPWYLPSAGEIGHYIARADRIRYALTQLGSKAIIYASDTLWSSTEANENVAWQITTNNGVTVADTEWEFDGHKSIGHYVRPFTAF